MGVSPLCIGYECYAWGTESVRRIRMLCVGYRVCASDTNAVRGVQSLCVGYECCAWGTGAVRRIRMLCVGYRVCASDTNAVRGVQSLCVSYRVCAWSTLMTTGTDNRRGNSSKRVRWPLRFSVLIVLPSPPLVNERTRAGYALDLGRPIPGIDRAIGGREAGCGRFPESKSAPSSVNGRTMDANGLVLLESYKVA